MTLFEIEVLVHHTTTFLPFPRWQAASYEPVINSLFERDLLINTDDGPAPTERGRKYLQMLCETPLPEKVWTDPRNVTQQVQQ